MLFQWTAVSTGSCRLLRRKEPLPTGELSFGVEIHELQSAPPYVAVSYMCGPPGDNHPVLLNGRTVTVRKNCVEALKQVEAHSELDRIWIDCLCIRLRDTDEKSRQAAQIRRIFECAKSTLVCLGFPDGRFDALTPVSMELGKKLEQNAVFSGAEKTLEWFNSLSTEQRESLAEDLLRLGLLPQWRRRWIIQEAQLGNSVYLLLGRLCVSLNAIVRICEAFCKRDGKATDELYSVLFRGKEREFHKCLTKPQHLYIPAIGGFFGIILRQINPDAYKLSLHEAFEVFRLAESEALHDAIYGIRELITRPVSLEAVYPDYSLPPVDLATKLLRYEKARQDELGCVDSTALNLFAIDLADLLSLDTKPPGGKPSTEKGEQFSEILLSALLKIQQGKKSPL